MADIYRPAELDGRYLCQNLDDESHHIGDPPCHAVSWRFVVKVTVLDSIKLFRLKVRKFNLETRFAHWVDPNRCFGEDFLFFAVFIVDANANTYPSGHVVSRMVFKDSPPTHDTLAYSRTSFARSNFWEV